MKVFLMLHLSKIWNRYVFAVAIFSTSAVSAAPSQVPVPVNDPYIQEFVRRCNSDRVEYQTGKLVLRVTKLDSSTEFVGFVASLLGCVATSLVGCYMLDNQHQEKSLGRNVAGGVLLATSASCAIAGMHFMLRLYYLILMDLLKRPYITFDSHGIMLNDVRVLYWSWVEEIKIESTEGVQRKSLSLHEKVTTRSIELRDKYARTMLRVTEDDSFLPVSFDVLCSLVQYYQQKYGKAH
jgi:hypothetical protein